jgi:predicted Zn-dependent peptidase
MPGLHSAAIGIWVNAGGRDERAEQNGIAHFLEHMAFKGTARAAPCRSPRRSRMSAAISTPIPRAM